jgi:large subunit ribosomal protein L6
MSRVGKLNIPLPKGVDFKIDGTAVTVKGPKGTLSRALHPDMTVTRSGEELVVQRPSDAQAHRALHGTTRAVVANMVTGVTDGFQRVLDVVGTGYRAEQDGKAILLYVGYSHPVRYEPRPGVTVDLEDRGRRIIVRGIDLEVVGQTAVEIRSTRPPEPYKGKGICYAGERVRRKAGKAGKVGK